jgi:hypothetical protein
VRNTARQMQALIIRVATGAGARAEERARGEDA